MDAIPDLARSAALIGDSSRAAMLCSLAGGQSRPAGELALLANVSPQTASRHLSQLVQGRLLAVTTVGRHKFYKLSGPRIADALESLVALSSCPPEHGFAARTAPELVFARTCYDHLAGVLGVAICEFFIRHNYVRDRSPNLHLTSAGEAFLSNLGVNVETGRSGRRRFAYSCLDWSQRLPHVGGALGAALLDWLSASKALVRCRNSRAVRVTPSGAKLLERAFSIRISWNGASIAAGVLPKRPGT